MTCGFVPCLFADGEPFCGCGFAVDGAGLAGPVPALVPRAGAGRGTEEDAATPGSRAVGALCALLSGASGFGVPPPSFAGG